MTLCCRQFFFEHAKSIEVQSILFEEAVTTHLTVSHAHFYKTEDQPHHGADSGEYVLEVNGEPVAKGGFMLNYNFPYADIYLEVLPRFRGQGFGSFLVQELKKEIYKMGRLPAARCNPDNKASKATLFRSGFAVCGALLLGKPNRSEG